MDRTEQTAYEYLCSRGLTNVVYEPDGNVPPDFLVSGRVAVEVRRLNQSIETAEGPRGLEQDWYPLQARFSNLLPKLGPPIDGESWYVFYDFERPLLPWPELRRRITDALTEFRNSGQPSLARAAGLNVTLPPIAPRFELTLFRAGPADRHHYFLNGGNSDGDSGGWLMSEMPRNIRLCIEEKNKKIAAFRPKYPEWWLVLVDRIGYGMLDEREQQMLRSLVSDRGLWAKIILVSPQLPSQAFEL